MVDLTDLRSASSRVLRATSIATTLMRDPRSRSLGLGHLPPQQRFAVGLLAVLAIAVLAWPILPRRYEATAVLVLRPSDQQGQVDEVASMHQALDDNAIQSELDAIHSPAVAELVIKKEHLAFDPEFSTEGTGSVLSRLLGQSSSAAQTGSAGYALERQLDRHLVARRDPRSYTIKLGYWSSDPVKAVTLTKALVTSYIDEQLRRKRQSLSSLSDWMAQRVRTLAAQREKSDAAVQQFLVQSGLIDSGAQLSLERQLGKLSDALSDVRARRIDAQSRAKMLAAMKADGALDHAPDVLTSVSIQRLKDALASAMAKPTVFSTETEAIKAQIATESDRIVQGAQAEAIDLADREGLLEREIKSIRDILVRRHEAEFKLNELRSDAAADKSVLEEALVQYKNQTARADALKPNVEILAEPELPNRPIFPQAWLYLLATALAGGLAGTALTWREALAAARRIVVLEP